MFFRAIYLNKTTVLIGQSEGLPNITGSFPTDDEGRDIWGAFYEIGRGGGASGSGAGRAIGFNAARSNSIYGNSKHVTPINASVKIWQRIS